MAGGRCDPLQDGRTVFAPQAGFPAPVGGGQGPLPWGGHPIAPDGDLALPAWEARFGSLIYGPGPRCRRLWPFSKCVFNQIKSAGSRRSHQLPESLGSCPQAQQASGAGSHVLPLPPAGRLEWRLTGPPGQGGALASVFPSVNGHSGYGKAGLEAHAPWILVGGVCSALPAAKTSGESFPKQGSSCSRPQSQAPGDPEIPGTAAQREGAGAPPPVLAGCHCPLCLSFSSGHLSPASKRGVSGRGSTLLPASDIL